MSGLTKRCAESPQDNDDNATCNKSFEGRVVLMNKRSRLRVLLLVCLTFAGVVGFIPATAEAARQYNAMCGLQICQATCVKMWCEMSGGMCIEGTY